MDTIKKDVSADLDRLAADLTELTLVVKGETTKVASQISVLKMEKNAIQHQVVALQRRLFNIDDELGSN